MSSLSIFDHLGLTKNEAAVYKAVLRMGPSSVSAIMERTKLHRPSVYRAIETLRRKNMLDTLPKGKRRIYSASPPSLLHGELRDQLDAAEGEIAALEYLYEKRPQKPSVRFIEGKQAIANAYLSIPRTLKKGDTYYRYSARDAVNRKEEIDKRIIRNYQKERDGKQLERYVITSETNYRNKKPSLSRSMKAIPRDFDLFDHHVSQVIYGNTILLIDYNSNTAIEIENPIMAHFQKRIFQLLFKLLPGKER